MLPDLTPFSSARASWSHPTRLARLPSCLAPHPTKNRRLMIRVKICGITNSADAMAAIDAGANLLGFNFYEKSPRHIAPAEAAKIRPQLPKRVKAVGIFVNALSADVMALRKSLKLDAVQLHGDESPDFVAGIASAAPVIKAFRV